MCTPYTTLPSPHTIDDKRHGLGYFVFGETGDRYEGQWKNGRVRIPACLLCVCVCASTDRLRL